MATFEIVPNSTITSNILETHNVKQNDCRRFCNDMPLCSMYNWTPTSGNIGTCILAAPFANIKGQSESTTFVKGSNPSYWMLILLGVFILLVLFYISCKKCKL